MLKNAVQAVDMNGKVETVWENGDTDRADSSLDQSCEVIVSDNQLMQFKNWKQIAKRLFYLKDLKILTSLKILLEKIKNLLIS